MSKIVDFLSQARHIKNSMHRHGLFHDLKLVLPAAPTRELAELITEVQVQGGEAGVLAVTEGYRIPSSRWPGTWTIPCSAYADVIASAKEYLGGAR